MPQAALLASFLADRVNDPWCDPRQATERRERILSRMRDNQAIDEAAYHAAMSGTLELGPPPSDHQGCPGAD